MKARSITIVLALIVLFSVRTYTQNYTWEALYGQNNNEGVNGNVYAITFFQNKIVVAGAFTLAGGVPVRNVAMWDRATNTWSALGTSLGVNPGDTVRALEVYNNELYAGGLFTTSSNAQNIAKWNGSEWIFDGTYPDSEVLSLTVFNGALAVGGDFENVGNLVASWNGSAWSPYGVGFGTSGGSKVYCLTVFNSNLIAAGRLEQSGSTTIHNVASWNGSVWNDLSSNTDERIFVVAVHNGQLYAGGRFTIIGGNSARYIARYVSGTSWAALAGGNLDDEVFAIASYSPTELVVGGKFKNVVGGLYLNFITKWNGTTWSRMITGMDEKVEALYKIDSTMYAGGEFEIAGGKRAHHIARWFNNFTDTIRGTVRYSDNNNNVDTGKVYVVRRDYFTNEVIVVDSGIIDNGTYMVIRPPVNDTLSVLWFPDDELDFVPTYYPSTIDWRSAVRVVPGQNTNNIDGFVYRIAPEPQSSVAATVHGTIHLNIIIPFDPPGSYPYRSTSVLYVKQGNSYKRFAISGTNENYATTPLAAGTYELTAYRLGYCLATANLTINPNTTDTVVNFTLDTCGPIGIHNISTEVPREFMLMQNYPNPFNPVTNINFRIPESGTVKLAVYDIVGREIAVLVNSQLNSGTYNYDWNASQLASGVYFYRMEYTGNSASVSVNETRKMVLIK